MGQNPISADCHVTHFPAAIVSLRALRTPSTRPPMPLYYIGVCAPVVHLYSVALISPSFFLAKLHSPDLPTPNSFLHLQQHSGAARLLHKPKMMEAWLHEDYYATSGEDNSNSSEDVLENGGGSASGASSPLPAATASAMRVRLCMYVMCFVHSFAMRLCCQCTH